MHAEGSLDVSAGAPARGLRVAFLLQEVRALYGTERATLALATALRGRGVEAELVLMHETRLGLDPGPLERAAASAGMPHLRLDVDRPFSPGLVRSLRRAVRDLRFDLLHVTGYKGHLHAALARACPVVTTVHGWLFRPDAKERFYGWLDLRLMRRDAAVICLSTFYESYLRRCGIPDAALRRIPTGLDSSQFPAAAEAGAGARRDVFTAGILGRLSSEKNHAMLLRAARALKARATPIRVLIAGDGPERDALERQIDHLDLRDVVALRGYMDAREFLEAVDALVLCSNIENLPCSILEAMAWRRPVVATRVGGIPDLVVDGETGRLVEADDDAALAGALAELASDAALARRFGLAGRARVERHFTLAACADRHIELYREIVRVT